MCQLSPQGKKNFSLIGYVKRARDFHLYTTGGRRFLDLYLNNGQALAGHKPAAYNVALKNPIEQGLVGACPNIWQARLEKALLQLLGCKQIGFFYSLQHSACGISWAEAADLWQPAANGLSFWRALAPRPAGEPKRRQIILLPETLGIFFIVADYEGTGLPPSDFIPGFAARAALRAAAALPKLAGLYKENAFASFKFKNFTVCGPYIKPLAQSDEEYEALFKEALRLGILLPPQKEAAGALPYNLSPGEHAAVEKIL